MKHNYFKSGIALSLLVAFSLLAIQSEAYPPFVRLSAKFGAKDCTFCHTKPEGGDSWNERGNWLIAEKDKRKADSINVEWLSEYASNATVAPANKTEDKNKWAELESFHEVMSQTFHPAEEGNLKPIRSQAGELAARAQKWLDSKAPLMYDVPSIKAILVKLTTESKALAELVSKDGSDDDVKKSITALHDRFHEIIGACRVEKEKKK
jgi:hypothetical protein